MTLFEYRQNELFCEETALLTVAGDVKTPVYVYSKKQLIQNAKDYVNSPAAPLICYAVKANGNPHLMRMLAGAGLGADVTSGGELFLAQQAGIPSERIIFSGVGKTSQEIHMALHSGIKALHVESEMEMALIGSIAAETQRVAQVGVRVNPDIFAETHPAISTGLREHKFGVAPETAVALIHFAHNHPWLEPVGLACHLGSQISDLAPHKKAARFLIKTANELADQGVQLQYLDVGGGLGVGYTQNDAPTIRAWVTAVSNPIQTAGYDVVLEPGRSIAATAGLLLAQVLYTKNQGGKWFAVLDAAMNDLIRPTLYDAYHPVVAVKKPLTTVRVVYDLVGPICETGDWLARERPLPPLQPGDLLAITHAGAYGFAMSSNYNGRLRPAEALVDGSEFTVIRRRETLADLMRGT